MIAEVCRFYHWTDEYCLKMPAIRFFSMLKHSRILKAVERMEECDIASIPNGTAEYFEKVRRRFENTVKRLDTNIEQEVMVDDSKAINPVLDAASDEAKYLMMAMFTSAHRH